MKRVTSLQLLEEQVSSCDEILQNTLQALLQQQRRKVSQMMDLKGDITICYSERYSFYWGGRGGGLGLLGVLPLLKF